MAPWLPLSPRRCPFRASGRAGSRTGRSPAAGGGAGGVLDAGAREPMIEACGERALRFRVRVYAVVVAPRPACGRAACWLRSSLRLSPGVPGGMGRVRAGPGGVDQRGARAAVGRGQNGRRPRARPQARTGHAACPRWRARRTSPSRIRRRPGSAAPGRRRPWRFLASLPRRAMMPSLTCTGATRRAGAGWPRSRPSAASGCPAGDLPADHLGVGIQCAGSARPRRRAARGRGSGGRRRSRRR